MIKQGKKPYGNMAIVSQTPEDAVKLSLKKEGEVVMFEGEILGLGENSNGESDPRLKVGDIVTYYENAVVIAEDSERLIHLSGIILVQSK